jgi:hypothetical protein
MRLPIVALATALLVAILPASRSAQSGNGIKRNLPDVGCFSALECLDPEPAPPAVPAASALCGSTPVTVSLCPRDHRGVNPIGETPLSAAGEAH